MCAVLTIVLEADMAIGTVKFFNPAHLKEGQRVQFDVITERGKSAAGNLTAV